MSRDRERVPDGVYKSVAVMRNTESGGQAYVTCHVSEKGTPSVKVALRIEEGPFTGRLVFWDGWLSEKALPYTDERLKAMGWSGNPATLLTEVLDAPVSVTVAGEEWITPSGETKTATKVASIRPIGGAVGKPVAGAMNEADARRTIAKAFGAGLGVVSPARTKPRDVVPHPAEFDDDIPF